MAFLLLILFARIVSTAAYPNEREDVIGQYALANEKQCNRLCLYRQLCTSYSYNYKIPPSPLAPTVYNCILHTNSIASIKTTAKLSSQTTDWMESSIATSSVNNGCQSRPCDGREVCVPASSNLAFTSLKADSYACLSLPSECGVPQTVIHGQVNVLGSSQDDVAYVKCDNISVASPKNTSLTMSCLVTSAWSALEGKCVQYKYETNDGILMRLPWRLEENSKICVQGTLVPPRFDINLLSESNQKNVIAHLRFIKDNQSRQLIFYWDSKENGVWRQEGTQFRISLTPGDNFNITLHVQSNQLELVSNDRTYQVPLNVGKANFIFVENSKSHLYMNLISGC